MSPRAYNLGQREAAIQQTRERILLSARALLTERAGGFTVDAVARHAGVARMTVYYQYGSKRGLLEAVYDDIAARGGLAERLPQVFQNDDPRQALGEFIRTFAQFWASDTLLIRRVRALAALDPDFEPAVQRDDWRRMGLTTILQRLSLQSGRPTSENFDQAVEVVSALTGFEFFDALAAPSASADEVARVVDQAVVAFLDL
jgi:AcrR family transcriptional regulator